MIEYKKYMETVEIFRARDYIEAQLIKNLLKSNGIFSILVGQVPSSVYPFTVDGLAEVRVLVNKNDASDAKRLLENREEKEK